MTNGTTEAGKKKGLSTIAWVAIGCGGLLLVFVVAVGLILGWGFFKAKEIASEFGDNPARAAAETIVRLNPELELVETDEEAGTITIRNERTGEQATLNFEDIAEGRFSWKTEEGEYQIDAAQAAEEGSVTIKGPEGQARFGVAASAEDVPDWVPRYPNATSTRGAYSGRSAEGVTGLLTCTTDDGMGDVVAHYRSWFEGQGYAIESESSTATPSGGFSSIAGEWKEGGRTVKVVAAEQDGTTQVTINYSGKTE